MKTLKGKKALVTGAASGIGREIAICLAKEGTDVFLVDIDEPSLNDVSQMVSNFDVSVETGVYDLADPDEVDQCANHYESCWNDIDILINNAGIAYYGLTLNMTDEQWEKLWSVNINAPVRLTRRLLPNLLDRSEAHVLNVASILGIYPANRLNAYCTSKSALIGFSEALRVEFGRQGLGVTAFCPGFVKTKLFESAMNGHMRETPTPPAIVCSCPKRVAQKAIKAIYRNQGLSVVTPMGRTMYFIKRFFPGLVDRVNLVGRRRAMRKKINRNKLQQSTDAAPVYRKTA